MENLQNEQGFLEETESFLKEMFKRFEKVEIFLYA